MAYTHSRTAPIAFCLALGFSACGDDKKSNDTVTAAAETTEAPEPSTTGAPDTAAPDTTPAPETSATEAPDTSHPEELFEPFIIGLSEERLVDPAGLSLYYFTNDPADNTVSTCYDGCASTWPPLLVGNVEELAVDPGLNFDNFNFIFRDDGGIQVTYWGLPLYYYVGDTEPGDVNGGGIGDVWFLQTVDGGGP